MSRILHDAGEALYGPRWQSALARDLGVSIRTMQRWAASADKLPPGVYLDLLRITRERVQALGNLSKRLEAVSR